MEVQAMRKLQLRVLVAGINAARFVQGKEGIVIDRSQGIYWCVN